MKNKQIGSMAAAKMIDNMSVFEAARWQALMDAVELIYEKSVDRKMDLNKKKIKPSAISKFIESTCDIYARNIERQFEQENVSKGFERIN